MARVEPRDLQRFLAGGWKSFPIVLIFGGDEGGVREAAEKVISQAAGPDPDPLNKIELTGDAVAADPARLADEMRAIGMFGGPRVVHVRNLGKLPIGAIEALADEPAEGALLVLEGGDLKKDAAIRKLADKHKRIAGAQINLDTARNVTALIDEMLSEHHFSIDRDARSVLTAALGADRGLSRAELVKLALYARGEKAISLEMVTDIVSDAGRHDASGLIDQAFGGNLQAIEAEANRIFAAGTHPSAVLTMAIGHVFFMRRAKRFGFDEANRSRAIHFLRAPAVERALPRWTEARLTKALAIFDEATLQTRQSARISSEITIRAFWATARLAGANAE